VALVLLVSAAVTNVAGRRGRYANGVGGRRQLIAAALTIAIAACGAGRAAPCPGGGACHAEQTITWLFQSGFGEELDVLLVVDDTAAIADQQAKVRAIWPRLMQLFEMQPLGTPSLHVGVVSASRLDAPAFDGARAAACGIAPPDKFLSTAPCGLQPNFDGTLETTISCLADLPAQPGGAPRPMAAARRALENEGATFLRPTAALWLIMASGADEAAETSQSGADFAAWLKSQRSNGPVVVSVIGPPTTCADPSLAAAASAAPQLIALVNAFREAAYVPLCAPDLTPAFGPGFASIAVSLAPACLGGIRDVAPATPGLQPQCTVVARSEQLDGSFVTAVLPACDSAAPPCWRLESAVKTCPGAALLSVDHSAGWCPQLGEEIRISCLGCVDANDSACALP
jgi:hypothetical protein